MRTTAYTHTESDHRQYSNRNALGGELRAAGPAIHRAEVVARATLAYEVLRALRWTILRKTSACVIRRQLQAFLDGREAKSHAHGKTPGKTTRNVKRAVAVSKPPQIGSAAADWSRWPAGTVFRLLSTGQNYRVEDYGWALSGRNTIDLYMANQREMNTWGARQETIEILKWGDPQESLQFLRRHQDYRHIKRMVLELEGREKEAASLR